MKILSSLALIGLSLLISSCNAGRFYDEVYSKDNQFTLGTVQKEIHQGMSQGEVAALIGSPNIVTQDKDKNEVWIYDKIATQVRESGSSGIILFFQTGADYVQRKDVSQQTLTVVIKFDVNKVVQSISYHSSRF